MKLKARFTHRSNYRYHHEISAFKKGNLSPAKTYKEIENSDIEVIEIPFHNGTKVPLSIIYKKEWEKMVKIECYSTNMIHSKIVLNSQNNIKKLGI
ncbi:hypothetical protein [Kordia sp.]|uniref:hypothetical protein n=1 Tax=Kordia sp. TaxID=1965332 RepID=UPI003D2E7F73